MELDGELKVFLKIKVFSIRKYRLYPIYLKEP